MKKDLGISNISLCESSCSPHRSFRLPLLRSERRRGPGRGGARHGGAAHNGEAPLSPALSPFVPHGARETDAQLFTAVSERIFATINKCSAATMELARGLQAAAACLLRSANEFAADFFESPNGARGNAFGWIETVAASRRFCGLKAALRARCSGSIALGLLAVAVLTGPRAGAAETNLHPAVALQLDLATVLRLAGAQNLDVQIATEKLAEARANHEAALLQFFPWLAPGVAYRRHDGRIQDVGGTIFDANKQVYTAGGALTAQVELGEAFFKARAAKQLVAAAESGRESQRQESLHTAAAGYFDLLKAQAAVGVAREAVRIAVDYADQVRRAVGAGIAFKGDALRAQVQAERNQLVLRQAEEQQVAAAARLAQTLHLDATRTWSGREGELVPLELTNTNAALAELVGQALAQRPELQQGAAFVRAARSERDGATYGPWVPAVGAQVFWGGLGGGKDGSARGFAATEDYQLGLTWRIGPGGLFDRSRIAAGEARLAGARLNTEKIHDDVVRQVVETLNRMRSLADQVGTARRALATAEESLKLARERKEFAVGVVLENIQAEQELTRARQDYLAAIGEFNKAQFALQRATGGIGVATGGGK